MSIPKFLNLSKNKLKRKSYIKGCSPLPSPNPSSQLNKFPHCPQTSTGFLRAPSPLSLYRDVGRLVDGFLRKNRRGSSYLNDSLLLSVRTERRERRFSPLSLWKESGKEPFKREPFWSGSLLKISLPPPRAYPPLDPISCSYRGSYSDIRILNFIVINFEVQHAGSRKPNF